MTPRRSRRLFVLASALAVGTTAVLVVPTPAGARPAVNRAEPAAAVEEAVLSASNGSNTVRFDTGGTVTVSEAVQHVAWAPDGSEAVYVGADQQVKRFRYDSPRTPAAVPPADPGGRYASPSYWKFGLGLIMAVKESSAKPWQIAVNRNPLKESSWPQQFVHSPDDSRHYLNPDATGVDWGFVFQAQPNEGGRLVGEPWVGMWDYALGQRKVVDNAANPAISPDGIRLAFVRSDGSHQQIFVYDLRDGRTVQVTSNPVDHDHPVWSPTGSRIAFSDGSGVATVRPDGSGYAMVPGLSGVPAYQSRRKESVVRLAGADRVGTAVAVSRAHWGGVGDNPATGSRAETVVLARSDMFADALGGTVLASAKQGPLLLTSPHTLDPATRAEMVRVLAPDKTVYLLGSTGAVSAEVQAEVEAAGYRVRRLSGPDRYSTAVEIANAIDPDPITVFAATGADFPDALAAGALAGAYNMPARVGGQGTVLLLTNDTTLPAVTRKYLDDHGFTRWQLNTIGMQAGTAMIEYAPRQTFGFDRYETAQQVAYRYFDGIDIAGGRDVVGVATGTNWPDALAGAALMGTLRAPLLLTAGNATTLSAPTREYLDTYRAAISTGYVFGSSAVVTPALADGIGARISGPGGYLRTEGGTTGTRTTVTSPAGPLDIGLPQRPSGPL
ncbi:cell wall-binding repeat-containing protein [Plantactinospora sp. BC1]|uniref:cell wall-binding repeat-containing protein n=1 Tax=Plantactinospora sp. BC1 TaxID=2108470 RepID=UPI00131F05F5|nr:cell wall-binding repeat-containing protein [Plantactinospora sp. BC1]